VFGAPNGQIGMLPLIAILAMTAIKDAIEDWRRSAQDDQVNNSATTKLGGWRNVNQPRDSRSLFERTFGLGVDPGRPSKGVKRLREVEASAGKQIVMAAQKDLEQMEEVDARGPFGSESSHDYMRRAPSSMSMVSKRSVGVLDWSMPTPGTASWERTLW
jgi:phospholipid-translocating ATPase